MSDVAALVDAFVEKVNRGPRHPEPLANVPAYLRAASTNPSEDIVDGWTGWRILRQDNSARIAELERRLGRGFPPSFRYLLANYSYPAFESGSVMFFANSGQDTFWELNDRLFRDKEMSPRLLDAGFLQIGNPHFYNYDPVCFDCNGSTTECRIVQLGHEQILQNGDLTPTKEIASSFASFLHATIR
jgi:hypothetical protein